MKGTVAMMKQIQRCDRLAADPPWDLLRSPETCYCSCGEASGSWEGFWRHTPDGAYGTHPAVETRTAHYLPESKCCVSFRTLSVEQDQTPQSTCTFNS